MRQIIVLIASVRVAAGRKSRANSVARALLINFRSVGPAFMVEVNPRPTNVTCVPFWLPKWRPRIQGSEQERLRRKVDPLCKAWARFRPPSRGHANRKSARKNNGSQNNNWTSMRPNMRRGWQLVDRLAQSIIDHLRQPFFLLPFSAHRVHRSSWPSFTGCCSWWRRWCCSLV